MSTIYATTRIVNPDSIYVNIDLKATLGDWKKIRDVLEKWGSGNGAWALADAIKKSVEQLESNFSETHEDKK